MIRLAIHDLEEDLQVLRSSEPQAPPSARTQEAIVLEIMLVRQIAILDDVLTSRTARGVTSSIENAPILERRTQAVHKLRHLRGSLRDFHDDSVIALPGSEATDQSTLLSQLTEAGSNVASASDEKSLVAALFGACTPSMTTINVPRDRLVVPIRVVADLTGAANDGGDADLSQHQAIRDVERDVLCVDGLRVSGGEVGYEGVCKLLMERMRSLLPSHALPGGGHSRQRDESSTVQPAYGPLQIFSDVSSDDGLGHDALRTFAASLLKAVNRTESGHWSFSLVQRLCTHPDLAVLVPDSSAAGPLTIALSGGPLRSKDASGRLVAGWGLRADVEATTVYNVFNTDCSAVLATLTASFRHSLVLPLAGVCAPPSIASIVGWERLGAMGSVTLMASSDYDFEFQQDETTPSAQQRLTEGGSSDGREVNGEGNSDIIAEDEEEEDLT